MSGAASLLENWNAQRIDRWAAAYEAGHHDDSCEQQERSSLCHCSKRRRIAAGKTQLPTDDLYFPPPDCPSCDGQLEYDGDAWSCPRCALAWSSSGEASSARWTDEYGDTIGGEQFGQRLLAIYGEEA